MTKKIAILTLATVILFLLPMHARAKNDDGFFGAGVHFVWENYRTPLVVYSSNEIEDLDMYGGPNLGGEFLWGINKRIVLSAAIDLGYFSHTLYPYFTVDGSQPRGQSETAHYFTFGALVAGKYYFWDPAPKKAVLNVSLGIGKYFSVCGNDYTYDIETGNGRNAAVEYYQKALDAELEVVGGLASPFVIQAALGGEFYVSEAFSIGADILGIRFTYASAGAGQLDVPGAVSSPPEETDANAPSQNSSDLTWFSGDHDLIGLSIYSGLVMNFNFSAGKTDRASSTAEEDDTGDEWGSSGMSSDLESSGSNEGLGSSGLESNGESASGASGEAGWATSGSAGASGEASWSTGSSSGSQNKKQAKKKSEKSQSDDSAAAPGDAPPPPPPPGY